MLWPIVAAWMSLNFPINALLSSVVFYGIPAGLLSFYRPEYIKKSLIVSLSGIPFLIIVDYIAELTGAWLWPLPHSVVPFKLFGYVSIEVLLWGFLHAYIVIMFFQYFFEKTFTKKILDSRSKKVVLLTTITFIIFLGALFIHPDILNIPYWYLVFGTIGILPLVVFEDWKYPKVFHRLLKTGAYFFYLNFTYEITALKV
ncbi:MAG: hypothetical protein AAB907_03520, partial [Patescibacteria group bacterium]